MLLSLSDQDNNKLHRLSQDKGTVEALKKLFLNQFIKTGHNSALSGLDDAFVALNNVVTQQKIVKENENMV